MRQLIGLFDFTIFANFSVENIEQYRPLGDCLTSPGNLVFTSHLIFFVPSLMELSDLARKSSPPYSPPLLLLPLLPLQEVAD